ncbi:MAG: acyl-CoA dehydrogenase family protein [Clostridia bacterium]|nr:acyl-CoA dehydrogenase family protein [Clostridia bacterium]
MINPYHLLNEEQLEIQALVREFCEKYVRPIVKECDEKSYFPMDVYEKICDLGINGMYIPEEFGGLGLDLKTQCIVREEIGKVDPGFSIGVGASSLAFTPVLLAGTDKQKQMYADHILNKGLASYCLTEPDGGSDAAHQRTTAKKVGNEYVINGAKCFITNGPVSTLYTVFASTDKELGAKGVSAFIVERDRKGVSVGKHEDKLGIRSSETSDVIFEDVVVPAENLVGKEGEGFKIAMNTLNRTRPLGNATVVGIMQACIDYSVEYAKQRVVFGKPISKFQAVQFMLADMEMKTIAARQMCWYVAELITNGITDPGIGAATKCFVSDLAQAVTTDAVQILGGYGYSREYPVEKLMRDAKIFQIFEGTNQIQRMTIANAMLKD